MRDYVVIGLVLASLPLILRKPFFGVLVWTWIGLMNPHRLCWGVANDLPLAQIVAITLLVSILLSARESKQIPWAPLTRFLAAWWIWMFVTTLFALESVDAWDQWSKIWRIMLTTFLAIMLLTNRERLDSMVWVMVASLGFYGVKGGIFTIIGGGGEKVWGPEGTFIGGNNEIGLALIMIIPLIRYLQLSSQSIVVKNGMAAAMALTTAAVLGTHSRGALLGLVVMVIYLTIKSRQRIRLIMFLALLLPAALMLMPESYFNRMETITNYQQDASAMGRINAWWFAWYVAIDRPIIGGGFGIFNPMAFFRYAPNPTDFHDAHSIYFKALAEHGFVGLALFLGVLIGSLMSLGRVVRFARRREELTWMRDMASLTQVSLIGYAASGAFLGLTYFDFYYNLVGITIALTRLKREYELAGAPPPKARGEEGRSREIRRAPSGRVKPNLWNAARAWYDKL